MPRDIDAELKALPELPRALVDEGYVPQDKPPPDYRECYTAAASARFPATRIRGRWYVHPRDYPKIAAVLCPRPVHEQAALPAVRPRPGEPAPAVARRRVSTLPSAA
jgi:hypothetical protein